MGGEQSSSILKGKIFVITDLKRHESSNKLLFSILINCFSERKVIPTEMAMAH